MSITDHVRRIASDLRGREAVGTLRQGAALTADDALALASLERACTSYNEDAKHAPIRLGMYEAGPRSAMEILILKPCRCGAPRAGATFYGASFLEACRAARSFVEALTPPDDDA